MSDVNEKRKTEGLLIERLKKNKYVTVILLLVTIVGGIESFTNSISNLIEKLTGTETQGPSLVQFALNPEHTSYYESSEPRFATGPRIKTFINQFKTPDYSSLVNKPVWQVTLSNPSDEDMIVTDIKYHVSDIGQVMGGEPGPLSATYEYKYELKYEKGIQPQKLVPPFKVPPKSSGAFDLVLFTNHPDIGLGWIMNVEFITNIGSVKTEEFQLYLSGSPDWALDMQASNIRWESISSNPSIVQQRSGWFSRSLTGRVMKNQKCPEGYVKVGVRVEPHWSSSTKLRVIVECKNLGITHMNPSPASRQ
ncbi:hypothetical protein CGK45_21930 [Vibrio parahaemolyticus]|uniref:hypothetical protein n=1 Tax=Vibrio parahaemolyticus TaxID=670 RepID=UPI00111E6D4E|nr:hypothetical protein [Vibrio parahaemolyticus]TNZ56309.1 hypothetical protein CGK45_21930 [Vibrio parahaemolyticus]